MKSEVLDAICTERMRQDRLWGDNRHLDDKLWMTILIEEVGELAKDLLDGDPVHGIEELVQVAAVSVAWLEDMYRRGLL